MRNNLHMSVVIIVLLLLLGCDKSEHQKTTWSVDSLLNEIGSVDASVAARSSTKLLDMFEQDPAILQEIVKGTQHKNPRVRMYLPQILAYCYTKADATGKRNVIDAMRGMLGDAHPKVRAYSAVSLGDTGSGAASAIPDLISLLQKEGEDLVVQQNVSYALGQMAAVAQPALPTLIEKMDADRVDNKLTRNCVLTANRIVKDMDVPSENVVEQIEQLAKSKNRNIALMAQTYFTKIHERFPKLAEARRSEPSGAMYLAPETLAAARQVQGGLAMLFKGNPGLELCGRALRQPMFQGIIAQEGCIVTFDDGDNPTSATTTRVFDYFSKMDVKRRPLSDEELEASAPQLRRYLQSRRAESRCRLKTVVILSDSFKAAACEVVLHTMDDRTYFVKRDVGEKIARLSCRSGTNEVLIAAEEIFYDICREDLQN